LALGLVAAGCGDDDDDSAAPSTSGAAATTAATTGGSSTATTASGAATTASGATATSAGGTTSATVFPGEVPFEVPEVAPGNTTTGVTDTEIHVSGIWTKSQYDGADVGAEARIKRANDAGGINGRKIVLDDMLDDGADQSKNLDAAKKIVGDGDTFAILPVMTASLSAADYLAEQKMPFFGWAIQQTWTYNEYGFGWAGAGQEGPTTSQNTDQIWGQLFPDKTAKDHTLALIGEDNDSAKNGSTNFQLGFEAGGMKVVFNKNTVPTPPAVVSDYSPYASQIIDSKAEMALLVTSFSNTLGLVKALQAQNYPGKIASFVLYDPRLAQATPGVYSYISFAPWESQGVPAMDQMKADVLAFKSDAVLSQAVAAGYFSADLFISILEKVGKDLTRENFMKVANGGFTWEMKDVTGPVQFPNFHQNGSPCGAVAVSDGTTHSVAVPYTCGILVPNPAYKPR
jgi:hypothetical protein